MRTASRARVRALLGVLASLAVVCVVFLLALPSIARYGAVWKELQTLTPLWIAVLVGAVIVNTVTSGLPWRVLLPGLGLVSALRITQASTALITVLPGGAPAGMALSFAMLRSRRVTREAAGVTVALTGIWSQLSTFAFPVIALAAIAMTGQLATPVLWAAAAALALIVAAVGLLVFGLADRRRALLVGAIARTMTMILLRLVRRGPPEWRQTSVLRLRRNTVREIRQHGTTLTLATLANQLTSYLIFDLSLRAIGIGFGQITIAESFTAWSLARLIESLPLTPGGFGFVELGLTGTLIAFGAPHAEVVASVLLYRALVVVPTLVFGAVAGLTWKLRWSS